MEVTRIIDKLTASYKNMSQQTSQSQLTSDLEDSQELKREFLNETREDNQEFSRTLYSLLHPGSIDWFVLRQFLVLFLIITLGLSAIYIIMDALNSADVFLQKSKQHNMSIVVVLFQYYMPRLLTLFDALLSAFIIVPGVVLVLLMIRHNETVALSCMGIRRVRAAYMIFVAAIVLIVFFAFCREFVLPSQRSIIGCDINSFFERDKYRVEPKSDPLTSVYISGESLDIEHKTIIQPVFNMPMITLDKYGQTITADYAEWKPEELGTAAAPTRPAGFLLKNVVAEKNLDNESSLMLNGQAALITPQNRSWPKKGDCFLISGIEIEDLTLNSQLMEYSSIKELRRIMERMPENQRRDAAIILHKRIAKPFVDFCVIFVGLSFILANDNRYLIILVKTCLWCGGSSIIISMSRALASDADQLISPALAAWIPLIIFSAVAAYVWDRVYY